MTYSSCIRSRAAAVMVAAVLWVYPPALCMAADAVQRPEGTTACHGTAYTVDSDPNGINIRSAPAKGAAIVRVIPYDAEGTTVKLAGSHGNWVLIDSAEGLNSEFRFQGAGWIYAPLAAVQAVHVSGRKIPVYREPHSKSTVLAKLEGETEVTLTGCQNAWMQVTAGSLKGWLAPGDFCGTPVTTCP